MGVISSSSETVWCAIAVVIIIWAWWVLKWVWLMPRKLEKNLRQQGFKGNQYKVLFGDIQEMSAMYKQSRSKPINLSDDIVPHILAFHHQSFQTYGKNLMMWFGKTPRVHIMDPELIKDVLNKINDFQKPKSNPLVRLLATGLASYEGDQWAKHRKLINPAFHLEKLKNMLPCFDLSCSEMIRKWEEEGSSRGSFELDVWPYLQALTSDAISRTAFGSSYEEGIKIFKLQKEQAELTFQAILSIYLPGFRYLPTKRNRRMEEIDKQVRLSLRSIIDKRLKTIESGEGSYDDLLGILLQSNFKEVEQHGDKSLGMSIQEVIEECKLFYFAGQETTSSLLVWTMVLLSQHQHWQSRAREEVFNTFGNQKPDYDGLNHLKVVTMILYEVLRLYPPVVGLTRMAHKDTVLGELIIPSGVQIGLPILLLNHDREIWGEDAKEFKPERFSEGVSKATKNQVSFFPFSWGPRICIGQNFAMLEAKMALAMILQSFSFDFSPSYLHAPFTIITLQPQYGAHFTLHKL